MVDSGYERTRTSEEIEVFVRLVVAIEADVESQSAGPVQPEAVWWAERERERARERWAPLDPQ